MSDHVANQQSSESLNTHMGEIDWATPQRPKEVKKMPTPPKRGLKDLSSEALARYERLIFGWLRQKLVYETDLEDLVQSALLSMVKDWDPSKGRPTTFLQLVTNRRAFEYFRALKDHGRLLSLDQVPEGSELNAESPLGENLPLKQEGPRTKAILGDVENFARKVVNNLSPEDRTVFGLQQDEGLTIQEIAKRLSIPMNQVKSAIRRNEKAIVDQMSSQLSTLLVDRKEAMATLNTLNKVPPEYREVFRRHHIHNQSIHNITQLLQERDHRMTTQVVQNRLEESYRAIRRHGGMGVWNKLKAELKIQDETDRVRSPDGERPE